MNISKLAQKVFDTLVVIALVFLILADIVWVIDWAFRHGFLGF